MQENAVAAQHISIRGQEYLVDLEKKVQVNKDTRYECAIRISTLGDAIIQPRLPRLREFLPSDDPIFGSLYKTVQMFKNSLKRSCPTNTGVLEDPLVTDVLKATSHQPAVAHVPPMCEPILESLMEVTLGGVAGFLVLTSYRVVFVAATVFLRRRTREIINTNSSNLPSYLMIKNLLVAEFGLRAFNDNKDEIRRLLIDNHESSRGASTQKDDYEELSLRGMVTVIPIGLIAKVELTNLRPDENTSWTGLETEVIDLEVLEIEQHVTSTMVFHCKDCRTVIVEVLSPSASEPFAKTAVSRGHELSLNESLTINLWEDAERLREEINWLTEENTFAPDILRFSTCSEMYNPDSVEACECDVTPCSFNANSLTAQALAQTAHDNIKNASTDSKRTSDAKLSNSTWSAEAGLASSIMGSEPATWQSDRDASRCIYCNATFTFTRRRHHCRHCGIVVCHDCSPHRIYHNQYDDKVRTCVSCHEVLVEVDTEPELGTTLAKTKRLQLLSLAQKAWEDEKTRAVTVGGTISNVPVTVNRDSELAELPWWASQHDYARLGLFDNSKSAWHLIQNNLNFELCATYPASIVLPKSLETEQIESAAGFRSRQRLPSLVWIHPDSGAPLCRCAQPRTGVTGQSNAEDIALLNGIRDTMIVPSRANQKQSKDTLQIFDARPKINAIANQLKGKGFERVNHYGGEAVVNLVFLDIANIHAVRGSLNAVVKACAQRSDEDPYTGVGGSNWIMHLHSIFRGAVCIADALQDGQACLVHCSDGWDRTSQLTSLAQLLLDPTYRTMKGFCQLIEKEWCSFGHMFEKRCGEYSKAYERDDSSPVFLQWLDVVHQFYRQFPRDFEFDERLLLALVDAVYSKW